MADAHPTDHYRTLGTKPSASAGDLRAAYLKLARANHPDKFDGENRKTAEQRMQAINEAWNVLGVAHKRREYDRTIAQDSGKTASQPGPRRGNETFRPFAHDVEYDVADLNTPDLDATPIAGSRAMPRWAAFVPVILVASGILILAFGTMVNSAGVFAVGIVCFVLGLVSFLMLPLLAMSRAERDPYL